MKKPLVASDSGAVAPPEFCHADSTGAGLAGASLNEVHLSVKVPIRTVNGTNAREHWGDKQRRARKEREAVAWLLAGKAKPALPVRVVLTREGPNRRAMDGDGLQAALKHVRDQVAEWLGVDDADKRITWDYWQSRGREYAVVIELQPRGTK